MKNIIALVLSIMMLGGCAQLGLEEPINPTGDFSGEIARIYQVAGTLSRQVAEAESAGLIKESQEEILYQMIETLLSSVQLARGSYTPENKAVLENLENQLKDIVVKFQDMKG